ncbi:MAG: hypothetical protein V3W34_09185 [Phycisphaerae bacterium]
MTERKRKHLAWFLLVPAMGLHLVICDWSTKMPDRNVHRIARVPNPVRLVAGRGSKHLYLGVDKRIGGLVGIAVGVVLPAALVAWAGFIGLNKEEFSQILGAGGCVLGGFGLVVFLSWAAKFW